MNMVRKLLLAFGLAVTASSPAILQAQNTLGDPGVTKEGTVVEQAESPPLSAGGENAPVTGSTASAIDSVTAEEGYEPLAPTPDIGMPRDREIYLPEMFTPTGQQASQVNDIFLTPMTFIISFFVLGLLLYAMWRFREKKNPVPSKTAHHTVIEVIWTLVPVLILVVIAVPSIRLIAAQYDPAPDNATTVKVTGYQWYWTYTYPDHGGFEVISNMLNPEDAAAAGEPNLLAVDNRMVVPAGVPIRIQTTAADVIHSFAVPSLWFKLDAVPGRLNERQITITKPGVYYGQCSELCGARHAFMPIAVEALPPERFAAWVRAQGGTMPGEEEVSTAVTREPEGAVDDNVETAGEDVATDEEVETVPTLQ